MGKPRLRLLRAVPGAHNLEPILHEFCKKGGVVTSFSDARLAACRWLVPEEADVEVLPFGEAVRKFMIRAEAAPTGLAQKGHSLAAITEACLQLGEDSPFYATAAFTGLHKRLQTTFDELRGWGVGVEQLTKMADAAEEPLKGKLKSLAFIDSEVRRTLTQLSRQFNSDRIELSLEIQPSEGKFERLLVLAGSDDEPLNVKWCMWAASIGAEVWVVVDCHPRSNSLFEGARKIAAMLGVEPESTGSSAGLAGSVFAEPAPLPQGFSVQIVSAADPLAEAEWAVRGCLQDLASGHRADRVWIYARDLEGYAPMIEAAARRLGLPVRVGRRVPLVTNSLVRLVLQAMKFCASGDVRELMPVAKSTYMRLSRKALSELATALRESYSQRDRQWEALWDWAQLKKDDLPWLAQLLRWRIEALAEPVTLSSWYGRLERLGEQPWREEALAGAPTGERDNYALTAMQRSLSQAASVDLARERREISLSQFVAMCDRLWQDADVTLPSALAGVQVVAQAEEIGTADCLYVLGMLEGVFPRRRSEDPVLTDADRAYMSMFLEDPLHDSHRRARDERDEFYRVCCAPQKKLVFSYPEADEDRDNVRAFYLTEIQRVVGDVLESKARRRTDLAPAESAAPADAALAAVLSGDREEPLPNVLFTEEAKEVVRGAADRSLSPRELREMLRCPFRYLAGQRLRQHPHRIQSRWNQLVQLPRYSRLPAIPDQDRAQHQLEQQLETELAKLFGETTEQDIQLMESGAKRLIRDWVDREFLAREIWPREDVDADGVTFESAGLRQTLKVEGGSVTLTGDLPAVSQRPGGYKVLHLFFGHEPWDDFGSRYEERPWLRLKEQDQFEFALYLLALYSKSTPKVGIEIDSVSGSRRLFLFPRPYQELPRKQDRNFHVTVIDQEYLGELNRFVARQVEQAVSRIRKPEVQATPGEPCRTCDLGELCRRSAEFSEEVDLFAEEEEVGD